MYLVKIWIKGVPTSTLLKYGIVIYSFYSKKRDWIFTAMLPVTLLAICWREQLSTWIVSNFKIVLSFSMSLSWTVVRIIKFAVAWSRLKQYRWFSWTTTSRNENVHSLVLIIYGLFQQMQLHSELIYLFTLTATEHASTFRTAGNEFTVCRCETQKRWNF